MRRFLLCIAVLAGICPAAARADLTLSFTPDGSAFNGTVGVGQTINVPIYLLQMSHVGQPDTTILTDQGLLSGGTQVDFTHSISGGASLQSFNLNSSFILPYNGWANLSQTASGGTAGNAGAAFPSPIFPAAGGPQSVLIATMSFQGLIANSTTTLSTNLPPNVLTQPQTSVFGSPMGLNTTRLETQPYGNIYWAGGIQFGGAVLHYTGTFTVTPEPTTILGACAVAGGLFAWRQKRKRK
jgi:hypothetical protein